MEWIKENKFVSGLLALTLLFVGGIFYHGYSEKGDYEQNMAQFTQLKTKHRTLVTAKPYPDAENLKAREQAIQQYEEAIGPKEGKEEVDCQFRKENRTTLCETWMTRSERLRKGCTPSDDIKT